MRFKNYNIPFSNPDLKKEIILPEKLTLELSEETGLHIGDGSMNFYRNQNRLIGFYQLRGHIRDDKKHYDTRIKELYQILYNLNPKIREMKSTGVYGFQIWSDALVNFKYKVLGLLLGNKLDIKISKLFFKKKDFLVSIIRGIFDTDGCVYLEFKNKKLYPRVEFKTVSPVLSEQIKKILFLLGLRATKYALVRKEQNWNTLYTVAIRGDRMINRIFKLIQPANPKHISKFEYYRNSS